MNLQFKDFVPRIIDHAGLFKHATYESFEDAVAAANEWLNESGVRLIQLETVVLPNIWNKWEEGSTDASLGTGDSPSHWHQFLRCWYSDE